MPIDVGRRYYYVNDGGDVWTPTWSPVKADLDLFETRRGLSYTVTPATAPSKVAFEKSEKGS